MTKDEQKKIAYCCLVIIGFILLIIFINIPEPYKPNQNVNVEEELERLSNTNTKLLSGSVYWNARPNANGRDWYNASESQKQWICDQMASVGNKNSKFWMQFFNSFYISNGRPDQATSSATINEASNLANAASRWQ